MIHFLDRTRVGLMFRDDPDRWEILPSHVRPARDVEIVADHCLGVGGTQTVIMDPWTRVDVPEIFRRRGLLSVTQVNAARWSTRPADPIGPSGWWTAMPAPGHEAPSGTVVHVWEPARSTVPDDLATAHRGVYLPEDLPPPGIDGQQAAQAAAWWLRTTGRHYHGTAGLATLDVLRESVCGGRGAPARRVDRPAEVAPSPDLVWTPRRRPTGPVSQVWDMRAAYLAAASAVTLGWGAPLPAGPHPPDDAVGWFRILVPSKRDVAGVPVVDPGTVARDGTAWVTRPTLDFLRDMHGKRCEIIDSYVSRTSGRLLRTWAEWWRDMLSAPGLPADRRGLLKIGYTAAIGMLGRPGVALHRPDWHDAIKAQARVSMLRRIQRVHFYTHLTPASVKVDAVSYVVGNTEACDTIDTHIGVGPRIGNMRRVEK